MWTHPGVDLDYRPAEKIQLCGNAKKTISLLNWKRTESLREMIDSEMTFYRS